MPHSPVVTFETNEFGDSISVYVTCAACGGERARVMTIPVDHLGALTVALVGACTEIQIDLSRLQAHVVTLDDHTQPGAPDAPAGGRQPADEGDRMDE